MFEIEVISNPSNLISNDGFIVANDYGSLTRYDEKIIKPALLLADKIHLKTIRLDFSHIVDANAHEITKMPLRWLSRFAHFSSTPDEELLDRFSMRMSDLAQAGDIEEFFNKGEFERYEKFAEKYQIGIHKFQEGSLETFREQHFALESPSINEAKRLGILTESPWHAGDVQTGERIVQTVFGDGRQNFIDESIDEMGKYLSSTKSSILVEPGTHSMYWDTDAHSKVNDPEFGIDPSLQIASLLAEQIPGLSEMKIENILEIREELKDSLIPFRASLLQMAGEISETDELSVDSLVKISQRKWTMDVVPALEDLKRDIKKGSYSRELLQAFSDDKESLVAIGAVINVSVGGSFAGLRTLVSATAGASFAFVKAWNEKIKKSEVVRGNRLYFLYQMDRRAPKK